jgi:hypothetical protein
MEKKYFTVEAIPKKWILNLPNFHILAHRNDDGVMCGRCLDFGIWAFSENKDDKAAVAEIFDNFAHMVPVYIIGRLKRGSIDNLYQNREGGLSDKWGDFFEIEAQNKIKRLKDSYNDLKKKIDNMEAKLTEEIQSKKKKYTLLEKVA